MVECKDCGREMTAGDSCTFNAIVIDEKRYERIRHGGENCYDCGTPFKGYHHYGCDGESCPSCGEQLILSHDCDIESIISDREHKVINFTKKSPKEYLKILREKGIIKF